MRTLADLGEKLIHHRWEDDLTVYILPRPGFVRRYASLTAGFGSVDLHFVSPDGRAHSVPAGVAHFLEHKMFEDPEAPVLDRFARLGASANAYTSYEVTSYLFSCVDNFWEALDILLGFVQEAHFTRDGVEKEKPIIEQEIRMGLDSPHRTVVHNLRRLLFGRHPVREDVAGSLESVRDITFEHLELCYRAFYHPSNLVLYVAGDVDPAEVLEHVARAVARRRRGPAPGFRRVGVPDPGEPAERAVEQRMSIAVPLLALGFRDGAYPGGSDLERRMAGEMALEMVAGRGSELFHRLYREGLIDDSFAASYACGRDWAFTVFMGRTPDPTRLGERLREGISAALTGWREADLDRCRRAALGQFISLFDSLEAPAYLVPELHFYGLSLDDYYRVLQQVDSHAVARYLQEALRPEQAVTSTVIPH
ncbi:MAG: insulinase family protein [Firmicutes bacterium]|nr:insulinase family protein [Bacillota bacterium]